MTTCFLFDGVEAGDYPIALRAYSATVPEQNLRDTDYDAVIVFLGVHKAGALMFLAKQGGTERVKFRVRA